MNALRQAREYLEQYQNRIDNDNFRGDLESRTRWEDASYKQSMMHAAIAQAEAADRIAAALERLAEAQETAVFGYGQSAVVDPSTTSDDDSAASWQHYQEIKANHQQWVDQREADA